jgi:hypothetical protein
MTMSEPCEYESRFQQYLKEQVDDVDEKVDVVKQVEIAQVGSSVHQQHKRDELHEIKATPIGGVHKRTRSSPLSPEFIRSLYDKQSHSFKNPSQKRTVKQSSPSTSSTYKTSQTNSSTDMEVYCGTPSTLSQDVSRIQYPKVTVAFEMSSLSTINNATDGSNFTAELIIRFRWIPTPRPQKVEQKGDVNVEVEVEPLDWFPDISFDNADQIEVKYDKILRREASHCRRDVLYRGVFQTKFYVPHFPFDTQFLPFLWRPTEPYIVSAVATDIRNQINTDIEEYIVANELKMEVNRDKSLFCFTCVIRRRYNYYINTVILPLFLIAWSVLYTFDFERDDLSSRVGYTCGGTILGVGVYLGFSNTMKTPYFTILHKYIVITLVWLNIIGLAHVLIKRHDNGESNVVFDIDSSRFNRISLYVLGGSWVIFHVLLTCYFLLVSKLSSWAATGSKGWWVKMSSGISPYKLLGDDKGYDDSCFYKSNVLAEVEEEVEEECINLDTIQKSTSSPPAADVKEIRKKSSVSVNVNELKMDSDFFLFSPSHRV